jgi:hypothetical protein
MRIELARLRGDVLWQTPCIRASGIRKSGCYGEKLVPHHGDYDIPSPRPMALNLVYQDHFDGALVAHLGMVHSSGNDDKRHRGCRQLADGQGWSRRRQAGAGGPFLSLTLLVSCDKTNGQHGGHGCTEYTHGTPPEMMHTILALHAQKGNSDTHSRRRGSHRRGSHATWTRAGKPKLTPIRPEDPARVRHILVSGASSGCAENVNRS